MTLDLEKYKTIDGKTPLNADYFNSRWYAIVRRIHALETVQVEWEAAVTQLQNLGLTRLNEAIKPLIDDLSANLQTIIASGDAKLAAWDNDVAAKLEAADAKIAAMDASIATVHQKIADILAANNRYSPPAATAGQTVFDLPFPYDAQNNGLGVYINGVKQYPPGSAYTYGPQDADGRATRVTLSMPCQGGELMEFVGFETDGISGVDYTAIERKAKLAAIIFG